MKTIFTFALALSLTASSVYALVDSAPKDPTPPPAPDSATPVEATTPPVSSDSATKPTPPAPEAPKAKHSPPKPLDQKGKIESVDAAAGTFTVGGINFKLSKKPRIEIDGALKGLEDLKVGDLVAVVYFARSDGTNTATRVIKGNAVHHKKSKAPESVPATSN